MKPDDAEQVRYWAARWRRPEVHVHSTAVEPTMDEKFRDIALLMAYARGLDGTKQDPEAIREGRKSYLRLVDHARQGDREDQGRAQPPCHIADEYSAMS